MAGSWQVEPSGVQSVLDDVGTAGKDIVAALRPLGGAVVSGGTAADGLDSGGVCTAGVPAEGLISAALEAFMQDVSLDIEVISTRVPLASTALHDAADAVIAGDEEMAASIQSTMVRTIQPGPARTGMQ